MVNAKPNTEGLRRTNAARTERARERGQDAAELFSRGKSLTEIARRLGVSTTTARRDLAALGLYALDRPGHAGAMTEDEKRRARLMLEDGQTYNAVADALGRDFSTIRRNVPGFPVLSGSERAERAVLGRQLKRVERKLR